MTPIASILDAVSEATGCDQNQIVSECRKRSTLYSRYITLMLIRIARPFHGEHGVGQFIGIEGQGSTRHALGKANDLLETDPQFRDAYERATAILRQSTESATAARD